MSHHITDLRLRTNSNIHALFFFEGFHFLFSFFLLQKVREKHIKGFISSWKETVRGRHESTLSTPSAGTSKVNLLTLTFTTSWPCLLTLHHIHDRWWRVTSMLPPCDYRQTISWCFDAINEYRMMIVFTSTTNSKCSGGRATMSRSIASKVMKKSIDIRQPKSDRWLKSHKNYHLFFRLIYSIIIRL